MAINIIFDGPPGHEAGRFVEVETDDGRSIDAGEWIERPDGFWALRITELPDQSLQTDPKRCPCCDAYLPNGEQQQNCGICGREYRVGEVVHLPPSLFNKKRANYLLTPSVEPLIPTDPTCVHCGKIVHEVDAAATESSCPCQSGGLERGSQ